MIADGVVAWDAKRFQSVIEYGPLFLDSFWRGDERIHDKVTAGDGEVESVRELVDSIDAFFPACAGVAFRLSVDIGKKGKAEGFSDERGFGRGGEL